jgi:hypothetical protein
MGYDNEFSSYRDIRGIVRRFRTAQDGVWRSIPKANEEKHPNKFRLVVDLEQEGSSGFDSLCRAGNPRWRQSPSSQGGVRPRMHADLTQRSVDSGGKPGDRKMKIDLTPNVATSYLARSVKKMR